MKKSCSILWLFLTFSGTAFAQNINLNWVQTETYAAENANGVFAFDSGNDDIVSGLLNVWVDINNQVHANALNRRNQQGQMVYDTVFDNNSYLDYRIKGFLAKNGETYYCLNYQNNYLVYEKLGTNGQLLWQQQFPRSNAFFTHERNTRANNWVLDDSLNNRMLWVYEQWNLSFTTRSVGILATDNATGAITIIDTLNYSSPQNYNAFAFELLRDNNNHIYMSSKNESDGMVISLLDNGQLVTEAIIDSAGFIDYPQTICIVGNTMYVTSQVEINFNYRVSKLTIYSIDAAGHLTQIGSQDLSDTQYYVAGIKSFGNSCYVYTSCYQNFVDPALVPVIWKYDNAGNLINTFTLSSYTGKAIYDLAITSKAIYCSMYGAGYNELEVIQPVTGSHLNNYNLLNEFSVLSNDGAQQVEAYSANANTDYIFVAGNKWIANDLFARLAKYSCTLEKTGIEDAEQVSLFSFFPNPAGDEIQFEYTGTGKYTVEILDTQGRLVFSQAMGGRRQRIDLSGIAAGLYFLRVEGNQQQSMQRFIRE